MATRDRHARHVCTLLGAIRQPHGQPCPFSRPLSALTLHPRPRPHPAPAPSCQAHRPLRACARTAPVAPLPRQVVQSKAINTLFVISSCTGGAVNIFATGYYWATFALLATLGLAWLYKMNEALGLYEPLFIIPLLQVRRQPRAVRVRSACDLSAIRLPSECTLGVRSEGDPIAI